ncbi:MAG: SRPBCC family protein [Gemmatimonadaceae bacterium]
MKNALKVTANGDREIVMTRSFDAPRQLVFEAMTKPELMKRWFGVFDGWTLEVCEVDLRVGGKYRYQWRGPAGEQMGMRGVYREVVAPERIVSTEQFDQSWYPGGAVGTLVLTEKGGKTTMTTTVRYDSREARDAVLKSPMETGAGAGYDNLEKFLATQALEAQ